MGGSHRFVDDGLRDGFASGQRQNAAVLCALGAQQSGQLAGVDVDDRHCVFAHQVLRQRHGRAEVGRQQRQVFDDQASGVDLVGFDVFQVDPVVADVRVRERHDLPAVAGVGEDFLVAGEGGVEHHLADGGAGGSDRVTNKDRAVCKREDGGGQYGKHG